MEARQKPLRRFIALSVALLLILVSAGSDYAVKVGPTQAQSFIVQGQSTEAVTHLVEQHGGTVTSRLDIVNGVGAELTEASKAALLAEPLITAITANNTVATAGSAPATDYPDVIGADLAWNEGAMGKGVTVAIIDTGLAWHPGLLKNPDGKFNNRLIGWVDFVRKGNRIPIDPNGHGTHVAGIVANAEKGADGEWNGVAPGVNLVGVRVLNEDGYGSYEQVIQGVQWAIKNKNKYNIRVMNLSLLSNVQSPYFADPLNQAVEKAWASGIVVVVAAGNGGPGPMSVMVPGNDPYVITVGAFTDNYTPSDWSDDYIAPFSAAGPTLDGFVKPDVVAPGAHMVSFMLPNAKLVRNHTANWSHGTYFSMAGTSQAAAVVSGVSALMLSKDSSLTPDEVKFRLQVTALPWIQADQPADTADTLYSMWQMGAGRVNAYDAVTTSAEGAANYGMDIQADLAGENHYEGFSYFDQTTGTYRLYGDFNSWNGAYGSWSGAYGSWSGAYGSWSGAYGSWSGAYGSWSGAYGSWSGAYGSWSGAYGSWSGAYGSWSGAYGSWSGGYNAWDGDEPWAGSLFSEASFVKDFLEMKAPSTGTSSVGQWVEEP